MAFWWHSKELHGVYIFIYIMAWAVGLMVNSLTMKRMMIYRSRCSDMELESCHHGTVIHATITSWADSAVAELA